VLCAHSFPVCSIEASESCLSSVAMIIFIDVPSDLFYWDICAFKHHTPILMRPTCDQLLLASKTGWGTLHYPMKTVSEDDSLSFITHSLWYGTAKSHRRLATGIVPHASSVPNLLGNLISLTALQAYSSPTQSR
jgi:hypothetical protein